MQGLTVGYFGASAGAAAALWAAAEPDADIAAVVSRCGRPDLAAPRLAAVRSPTLLIVGGHDTVVLGLNRDAQAQLRCDNQLEIIPGATHLFEELGTLQTAADLFVLNLECAITNRGERWPDPSRPFFFRAPPVAADVLTLPGVDGVTPANNHALDYGTTALLATFGHLERSAVPRSPPTSASR